MTSSSDNKISEEFINPFNKKKTSVFTKILEEYNYTKPFDGLKDLHLLRALAINRPKLTSYYIHLHR